MQCRSGHGTMAMVDGLRYRGTGQNLRFADLKFVTEHYYFVGNKRESQNRENNI